MPVITVPGRSYYAAQRADDYLIRSSFDTFNDQLQS